MEFDVTDATFEDDFIPTVISLINQDKFEVNDFDGAVNLETHVDTLLRNILDSTKGCDSERLTASCVVNDGVCRPQLQDPEIRRTPPPGLQHTGEHPTEAPVRLEVGSREGSGPTPVNRGFQDRAGEKISAQLAYLREIGRLSVDQLKDSIEHFSDGSELKNMTRRETFLKM
ncbi:unnamed protein product [Trifolium pratense]|uniref:Uncharacterized protein n=1 Tax=Trifolium pratense TaxID=57577 RepID=A0ACB0LLS3_TRIPR|nr:unnamed protein product [Trifolium pratense]